ncbi:MAG: hypothetical protein NC517_03470 [Firmicutes bacterium]|nr:hypothetical protein [Bacillota bacterium]
MKKRINKYTIVLAVMAVISIVLLIRCFGKEELVFSADSEQAAELAPGVYRVYVRGVKLPEGGTFSVTLNCASSTYKALRGNTVGVYAGQEETDFEVYVLDTLQGPRLEYAFANAVGGTVEEISLYRTRIGARLLLCLFLLGGGLVCGLMRFRDGILSGKIPVSRQVAVWTLAAGIVIAFLPYLSDYFIMGADTAFHLLRIEGLKETLLYGNQFPVRVQDYWLYDHGYMTSTFYSDFFLYIPAILRIIGFPLGTVWKSTIFLVLVLHALIAFHCLRKCTGSDYAALLGSLCTLLSPYNFHNMYNRGALGEYMAMAFLPLIIAGMFLLYTGDTASPEYKRYKWYVIAGLSAVLQCHLITCEMSVVMVFAFCLIHWKKTIRKKTLVQFVQTAGVILLINCFFWLPMLHMMGSDSFAFRGLTEESIQSWGITLGHLLQLTTNKGGILPSLYNAAALQPGAALLFALLVFVLYGFRSEKEACRNICARFFGCTGILLVLSTKYFPWDALKGIPVLNFLTTAIQFPYRLLSPTIMFGGFFLAFFYLWAGKRFPGWIRRGCVAFLGALCLVPAIYQANDIAFHSGATRLYSAENMGTVSVINGEYLLDGAMERDYYCHGPVAEEHIVWSDYEKQGTVVRMNIANTSSRTEYIEVPLTGYLGYTVTSPLYIAEERGAHGDLRIGVPGGYLGGQKSVIGSRLCIWPPTLYRF